MSIDRRIPANHRPGASYLTVREVATELRVSRMAVYRLVNDGVLSHLRIGRTIRITETALDTYLRAANPTERDTDE